jgi:hypothetical protein
MFVTSQPAASPPLLDPILAFTNCVAFTSHPASLAATLPPVVSSINSTQSFHHASVWSFTTSTTCADSGINAQPLANACSTWLSVDPGVPSITITLPNLNPLPCVLPIIMVPTVTSLLPNQALAFVASFALSFALACTLLQPFAARCIS